MQHIKFILTFHIALFIFCRGQLPDEGIESVSPEIVNLLSYNEAINSDWWNNLSSILGALSQATLYLQRYTESINLDGVIGLRMLEGRVTGILDNFWEVLPSELTANLTRLQKLVHEVAHECEEVVKRKTSIYYKNVGALIQPFSWSRYYKPRELGKPVEIDVSMAPDNWNEKESDDCMHELMQPKEDGHCQITPTCWKTVSQTPMSGYSLSHQLIYLIIGEQFNCAADLDRMTASLKPPTTVSSMMRDICRRMIFESQSFAEQNFPYEIRDLFMEEIGMCAYAGFLDVCELKWLPNLLSWQSFSGCYYKFDHEMINLGNFDPNVYGKSRRKRSEILMPGGSEPCLAHRTAVAMSALTGYLTKLIEQKYRDV